MKRIALLIAFTSIILSTSVVGAKEVKFEASLDRTKIAIDDQTQLALTFSDTQSMVAPDIGNIEGLDLRYLGPSTMMTVINGHVSSSITHLYKVSPLKIGKFKLGPFSFNYKGDSYMSNDVALEVTEEKVLTDTIHDPYADKIRLDNRIFVRMEVAKSTAYVNELVPVTVKLYVNQLNVRDIQLPAFAQEGFSKAEFKEPKQYQDRYEGLAYDVLEFKTDIFATRPGSYKIGPAKVKCSAIIPVDMRNILSARDEYFRRKRFDDEFYEDYFKRYEKHPLELKSEEVVLEVLPLPQNGRPADFSGAVGDFQFVFNANPLKTRVGDPITITMEINGKGNFNTVLKPRLENTDKFKVYEPDVKTNKNQKVFTQVIIPESDLVAQTPRGTFSYFDTVKKQYKTIAHGSIPIRVEKASPGESSQLVAPPVSKLLDSKSEEEKPMRDIIYIKDSVGILKRVGKNTYGSAAFKAFFICPAIFLLSLFIVARKRDRLKRDAIYAGRLKAAKISKTSSKTLKRFIKTKDERVFYETLFTILQDYLGNRLDIAPGGLTFSAIEDLLSKKPVETNILGKIKDLFDICDKSRFGYTTVDAIKMTDDLKELLEIFRFFERTRL